MRRYARHVLFITFLFAVSAETASLAVQNNATATVETAWSLAAVGDAIMTRQARCLESDPAFMALVKSIREADAAVINLELNVFRLWDFKGYPQAENGGQYEVAPPEVVDDM